MNKPEISVVVPVYNTAEYLERCISSITNQTLQNIEIICVNDGSTDGSRDILERFAAQDARISIIHRDCPSGSAALPRNIGLERAKGKYIIFLDSDDYFDCRMFEKMYQSAEEHSADLVMCDCYVVSARDEMIDNEDRVLHHKYITRHGVFSYQDIPDTIFQISNADIWHKLISRDLLLHHLLRFQENTPSLDDLYFVNLLLMLANRIYILDEKLVFYREARSGCQTAAIARHKESIYFAFKALNDYLIEKKLYDQVKKSLQNWTLDTLMWWYYGVKDPKIEEEVFLLYRNCYFKNLGLIEMKESDIYHSKIFYDFIMNGKFQPSIDVGLGYINIQLLSLKAKWSTTLPGGARLVIYGAGRAGRAAYRYIGGDGKYTIKLWCDKNAASIGNPLVQVPEKIVGCEYDAVLIAIVKKNIASEVKGYLMRLGVDESKIFTI